MAGSISVNSENNRKPAAWQRKSMATLARTRRCSSARTALRCAHLPLRASHAGVFRRQRRISSGRQRSGRHRACGNNAQSGTLREIARGA